MLAITPGEPAGIGPELVCRLAAESATPLDVIAIADRALMEQTIESLNLDLEILELGINDPKSACIQANQLRLKHVPLAEPGTPGTLNIANARYVLNTLDTAIEGCLAGEFSGLVTGPVQKSVINDAGIPFSGHTEYLCASAQREQVVMMLATKGLRVALATTHLPLKDVPAAITAESLQTTLDILHHDLVQQFGIAQPRILVCGLNPHAGEGGHMGREEIDVIEPVLHAKRKQGMNLIGPLPADTLFTPKYLDHADAVLAMYHDQGLPVLKYKGFGAAVNITLGLPFTRTSVDHGTALDLAGKGIADLGSLKTALSYAQEMTQNHR